MLEVLAHYMNTGKETLSPFIDSSIDDVLLLNRNCYRLLHVSWALDQISCLFISTHILLDLLSLGSAEAYIEWGEQLNVHLMASCVRNICTKNYQNLIIGFQVTVKNVGDAFLDTV